MNIQNSNTDEIGADAYGKAIAARLTEGADDLPHDISERLKAARMQAIARRRVADSEANPLASDAPLHRATLSPKLSLAPGAMKSSQLMPQTMLSKP